MRMKQVEAVTLFTLIFLSLHSFQYPRLEIEDRRRRGRQRLDGITGLADMSLSKLR